MTNFTGISRGLFTLDAEELPWLPTRCDRSISSSCRLPPIDADICNTNSSVDSPAFSGIPETRNCYTDVHGLAVLPELQYDLIDLYW